MNVRFCSAEAMQIYSKLTQLLSERAVSGQPVSVKITRSEKKKAEVTPLISLKKSKGKLSQVELNVSVTYDSKHAHKNSAQL